jgi:hypothetical protein
VGEPAVAEERTCGGAGVRTCGGPDERDMTRGMDRIGLGERVDCVVCKLCIGYMKSSSSCRRLLPRQTFFSSGTTNGHSKAKQDVSGAGRLTHHRPPSAPPPPPPRRGSSGPICDTAKSTRPAMGSQYFCRKDFSTGGAAGRPVEASTAGAPASAGLTRSARVWVSRNSGVWVSEVFSDSVVWQTGITRAQLG